jgi:hypothetical protein
MRGHLRHEGSLRARFHQREEQCHKDREHLDDAGRQADLRREAIVQAQRAQQRPLADQQIIAFDEPIPSFLYQEYQHGIQD